MDEQTRAELSMLADADLAEARKPLKGRTVTVTGGRKLMRGLIGRVFWRGQKPAYGYHHGQGTTFSPHGGLEWRVGLELGDASRVFTAERNVTLAENPLDYVADWRELVAQATANVAGDDPIAQHVAQIAREDANMPDAIWGVMRGSA